MSVTEPARGLARHEGGPAVTITCPLDRRRPGNAEDRARLDHLVSRARHRLAAIGSPEADRTADRLAAAVARLDLDHPRDALAIFAAPDLDRTIGLDAPVPEGVTVGSRFAVAALLAARGSFPSTRVLVCSRARTRCIEIEGGHARERTDSSFPVAVEPPIEADAPHRDFPLDEHEAAEAARFVFRAVRRALETVEATDPRPLVVVGAARDLAFLREVGNGRLAPIAAVTGNHLHDSPDAIAALVAPAVAQAHDRAEAAAVAELREALGARAVAGVDDVIDAARVGRVHRLVVERDLRAGPIAPAPPNAGFDGSTALDRTDEIVAEVIRHDGEVTVVGTGALAELGGIACTTRF